MGFSPRAFPGARLCLSGAILHEEGREQTMPLLVDYAGQIEEYRLRVQEAHRLAAQCTDRDPPMQKSPVSADDATHVSGVDQKPPNEVPR